MTRGWKKSERTALLSNVKAGFSKNIPLKQIFTSFAEKTGRKADSVRNFYYSCVSESRLRGESLSGITKNDIEVFSDLEIEKLCEKILSLCSKGFSVRGAILELTSDKKKALRYQNKYRNLIRSKNSVLLSVLEKNKLNDKYYDPFTKRIVEIRKKPLKTLVADKSASLKKVVDLMNTSLSEKSSRKSTSN